MNTLATVFGSTCFYLAFQLGCLWLAEFTNLLTGRLPFGFVGLRWWMGKVTPGRKS